MSVVSRGNDKRADIGEAKAPLPTDPISVRIATAVQLTGLSRSVIYELIGDGRLKTVKFGRSTLILFHSLRRLVEHGD